ncbi:MAG TPA: UDP-N-acetylmuramoyl-tripeptide--D-alanyl-D-alanine ligase, partial [Mariniflexile sp.]|nr:UDP-N-acetylmuramoyl-tripeptide--D-alanyl-D-alanine ligase [Mariniflexile sp.]
KIAFIGDMFELGTDAETEHQNIANLALSLEIDQLVFIGDHFSRTKINSEKASQYKTFQDFKETFNGSVIKNAVLLIKGSRGMALERLLEIL